MGDQTTVRSGNAKGEAVRRVSASNKFALFLAPSPPSSSSSSSSLPLSEKEKEKDAANLFGHSLARNAKELIRTRVPVASIMMDARC